MSIMVTQSGRRVSLVDPQSDTIDLRDIAIHLSRLNRFAGATALAWNVAAHSLTVADWLSSHRANARLQLLGLLHDAHEAYTGDIIGPLQAAFSEETRFQLAMIKKRLDTAIRRALGLAEPEPRERDLIAEADAAAFATEWRDFMPGMGTDIKNPLHMLPFSLKPLNEFKAAELFLDRARGLYAQAGLDHVPLGEHGVRP